MVRKLKIIEYKMHQFRLELVQPYRFAESTFRYRPINIVAIKDELGNVGLGEVEAFEFPTYIEEIQADCVRILKTRVLPLLGSKEFDTPFEFSRFINSTNAPYMARAAVEMAIWDLFSKRNNISVQKLISLAVSTNQPLKKQVSVGVAIGIKTNAEQIIQDIEHQLDLGYTRIKLKVNHTYTVGMLKQVRQVFPKEEIMIDCNSQFSLRDKNFFQNIDGLNFSMIEQPFSQKDFRNHAKLQSHLMTPLCLDENIRNSEDIWKVVNLGAAKVINMKLARVGGIANALALTVLAENQGLKVWCGGMLETGIGRAYNLALASMPFYSFPGDISASNRYYKNDVIREDFQLEDGKLNVPEKVGLGVTLNPVAKAKFNQDEWIKI